MNLNYSDTFTEQILRGHQTFMDVSLINYTSTALVSGKTLGLFCYQENLSYELKFCTIFKSFLYIHTPHSGFPH